MKMDGEIGTGNYSHTRWCSMCNQYHGILYNCEHYPKEIRAEIERDCNVHVKNIQDPKWIKRQIQNGIPAEAIVFARIFAGIE